MSCKGNCGTAPRVFFNYIFFDNKKMNYVRAGFLKIITAARGVSVHEMIRIIDN